MKRSKFSETKIISILNENENGRPVSDLCREYGIGQTTFYKWKSKYGGMTVSHLKQLKELEEENRKLKQMYADVSLRKTAILSDLTKTIAKEYWTNISLTTWIKSASLVMNGSGDTTTYGHTIP